MHTLSGSEGERERRECMKDRFRHAYSGLADSHEVKSYSGPSGFGEDHVDGVGDGLVVLGGVLGVPAGEFLGAGDEAGAVLEGEVCPGPLTEDGEAVAEADEEEDVDDAAR